MDLCAPVKVHCGCGPWCSWLAVILSAAPQAAFICDECRFVWLVSRIFGHVSHRSEWQLVKIDFRSIFNRRCTEADYQTWHLHDQVRLAPPSDPRLKHKMYFNPKASVLSLNQHAQRFSKARRWHHHHCLSTEPYSFNCHRFNYRWIMLTFMVEQWFCTAASLKQGCRFNS